MPALETLNAEIPTSATRNERAAYEIEVFNFLFTRRKSLSITQVERARNFSSEGLITLSDGRNFAIAIDHRINWERACQAESQFRTFLQHTTRAIAGGIVFFKEFTSDWVRLTASRRLQIGWSFWYSEHSVVEGLPLDLVQFRDGALETISSAFEKTAAQPLARSTTRGKKPRPAKPLKRRRLTIHNWREDWRKYVDPPTSAELALQESYLRDAAELGFLVRADASNALLTARLSVATSPSKENIHLALLKEYSDALETLGAWGWAMQHRARYRTFMDSLLAYPFGAPGLFFRSVQDATDVVGLFRLPSEKEVVRLVRHLSSRDAGAREINQFLNEGMVEVQRASTAFFAEPVYSLRFHGRQRLHLGRGYDAQKREWFEIMVAELSVPKIANGDWYMRTRIRATRRQASRLRDQTTEVALITRRIAIIAWALHREGLLESGDVS